ASDRRIDSLWSGHYAERPYMTDDRHEVAGSQPPLLYPQYKSNIRRAPSRGAITLPSRLRDLAAPVYGDLPIEATDNDLTRQHDGEPQGERIIVSGHVLDEDGGATPHTLLAL